MSNAWDALLGVVVGGALGIIGNWIQAYGAEQREIKAIKAAFRGEISAIITLVEHRDYIKIFRDLSQYMRQTRDVLPFNIVVTQKYFQVYEKNLDKIGKSGSEARDICNFYTNCFGVLEDFETIRAHYERGHVRGPGPFLEEQIMLYSRLADFLEATMAQAKSLERRLGGDCQMCTPVIYKLEQNQ
jgi:hypothetical protein